MAKSRLDQALVERGLVASREKAQALILAGEVFVNGQKANKASDAVAAEARIEIAAKMPYVSRGGLKLAHGLDRFSVDVAGRVCLDVGASTGGFTDCMLQRGALRVHAVDVGHGQLDWKLRNDARVRVYEGVNARGMTPELTGELAGFASMDVSFISATMILPVLPAMLLPEGEMVVLVKPQFEVGREQVGKGGIVRDAALHEQACAKVRACAESLGFRTELTESPILGAEGNHEFLLHAHR